MASILGEVTRHLQRAAREAAREEKQRAREAERAEKQRLRENAMAAKAAGKAARTAEADKKKAEKAAYIASREAEVADRNAVLGEALDEIDNLLVATLDVDPFIEPESLRRTIEHPPFDRTDLEIPLAPPVPVEDPPAPTLADPAPVKGLFGRKKKAEQALATARSNFERACQAWEADVAAARDERQRAMMEHAQAETARCAELEAARIRYDAECAAREQEIADHNSAVETLIANLGYGAANAVEEYFGIVLSNSAYPEHFQVEHAGSFDPATAELTVQCDVPEPDKLPTIRAYKYTKSTDEITETAQTQKAARERYAGAVQQASLRTLREIFEADRRKLIRSVALRVQTTTIDPATGKEASIPFVAVASDRESFLEFELSSVVPSATLDHLGASVSKNPWKLVAADTSGVRKS